MKLKPLLLKVFDVGIKRSEKKIGSLWTLMWSTPRTSNKNIERVRQRPQ